MNYSCPVCAEKERIFIVRDTPRQLYQCRRCDLQFYEFEKEEVNAALYDRLYEGDQVVQETIVGDPDYIMRAKMAKERAASSDVCQVPRLLAVTNALQHFDRKARILDVGCGEGALVRHLLEQGWDAYGCDISLSVIELCREYCANNERFFVIGSESWQSSVGLFDIIVCVETIEHNPNPRIFLDGFRDFLRDGGGGVFTVPNRRRFGLIARRLCRRDWQRWDFPPHHFSRWSQKALKYLLDQYFEDVRVTCSKYKGVLPFSSLLSIRWGINLVGVCRGYYGRTLDRDGGGSVLRPMAVDSAKGRDQQEARDRRMQ